MVIKQGFSWPLVELPKTHCSLVLHICRPSSRSPDTQGCSWRWAPHLRKQTNKLSEWELKRSRQTFEAIALYWPNLVWPGTDEMGRHYLPTQTRSVISKQWEVLVSPLGTSSKAKRPTLVSPLTVHFWVSQLGWQQWFMKRAWLPLGPASMIRS